MQTSSSPWQNFLIDFCLYRTNSHFGYRAPRKMWIPKQFHFPQLSAPSTVAAAASTSYQMVEYYSKSMSNLQSISETIKCGQNVVNDMHTTMPTIKCSLCKSSTPNKPSASQFESDMYESIMLDVPSDFSSCSSDTVNWPNAAIVDDDDVQLHGDHCANRFVVRIFAQSK